MEPTQLSYRSGPFDLRLSIEASGPVPAATAWERYARPELWPTWSPQLRSVSVLRDDRSVDASAVDARLVTGMSGLAHGPVGVSVRFCVIEVDAEARSWSWVVRRGPVSLQLDHTVAGRPAGDGSRTTLTLHGPAPLVLGYAPLAWYALHRLVTLPA